MTNLEGKHMTNGVLTIQSADVPVVDVGGAQVQFLSSETEFIGKTLDVLIGILQPGVFVPLHSHTGPEWFFLLEGEMEAYTGDEQGGNWGTVHGGELVVVPEGVRHAWNNKSSHPVRVLSFAGTDIFAVMRKVAVASGSGQAPTTPTQEFLQDLQATAVRTGNWIASPEENAAIGLQL